MPENPDIHPSEQRTLAGDPGTWDTRIVRRGKQIPYGNDNQKCKSKGKLTGY